VTLDWAPAEACTLPTAERPLRQVEFDDLFTAALRAQERVSPTRLRWTLDPAAQARARELTAAESTCCSFFVFSYDTAEGAVLVDVDVPGPYVSVLDALEIRAAGRVSPAPPPAS
jgi:hypothetical protein